MMAALRVKAHVTETGELKLDTPLDLPPGEVVEVEVYRVEFVPQTLDAPDEDAPLSGHAVVEWLKTQEPIDFDGLSGEEWVERSRREFEAEAKRRWTSKG